MKIVQNSILLSLIVILLLFYLFRKKYVEPSRDEGFSAIVKINFIQKFNDPELEKLYKLYLLEK
jgi:bifunctional polynucleotide phosphatase/kinase